MQDFQRAVSGTEKGYTFVPELVALQNVWFPALSVLLRRLMASGANGPPGRGGYAELTRHSQLLLVQTTVLRGCFQISAGAGKSTNQSIPN